MKTIFIGVDGGGSGSRLACRCNGEITHYSSSEKLQLSEMGISETANQLCAQIKSAFLRAGSLPDTFKAGIAAGIAGCDDPDTAVELETVLETRLRQIYPACDFEIFIMSDLKATILANCPPSAAHFGLFIAGTGSVFAGLQTGKPIRIVGGYGPAVFEACSGRQLGRDFITLLTKVTDEDLLKSEGSAKALISQSGLSKDWLSSNRGLLIKQLYTSTAGKAPASLARNCLLAAEKGHPGAVAIIKTHIKEAKEMIAALHRLHPLDAVAIHGGLTQNDWFYQTLKHAVQELSASVFVSRATASVTEYLVHFAKEQQSKEKQAGS
ncbi:MAG: hypothetical protein LAT67_11900 [Balneolales bacterium]|nr:hypothetical protein [Balneolales bacterium]